MKIPLFDLDGTLLQQGAPSQVLIDAYHVALTDVYQLPQATLADKDTVPDGVIETHTLLLIAMKHGFTKEEALEKVPQASKIISDYFLSHKSEENSKPHQGAKELLITLKQYDIHSGILTGNNEIIGWEKLRQAGLKKYISFGAFGNMAVERKDLIPVAQEKYRQIYSDTRPYTDFVIIGDTPIDIMCARDSGISVIAVPTGDFTKQDLQKENPDLLVESLEEKEKIISFLERD